MYYPITINIQAYEIYYKINEFSKCNLKDDLMSDAPYKKMEAVILLIANKRSRMDVLNT